MDEFYIRLSPEQVSSEFIVDPDQRRKANEFGPFSPVNIFVGANNSRKSRFCRHILSQKELVLSSLSLHKLLEKLQGDLTSLAKKFRPRESVVIQPKHNPLQVEVIRKLGFSPDLMVKYVDTHPKQLQAVVINSDFLERRTDSLIASLEHGQKPQGPTLLQQLAQIESELELLASDISFKSSGMLHHYFRFEYQSGTHEHRQLDPEVKAIARTAIKNLSRIRDAKVEWVSPKTTYIPTLRGMLRLYSEVSPGNFDVKLYEHTVRRNFNLSQSHDVWTGLDLYDKIRELRNEQKHVRRRFEGFESFLSMAFFGGKPVDVVATGKEGSIRVWVKDNGDRELFDLGDGIQAVINLMFPLFMADDGQWFFLEEPEVHLHPGFQTLLMNTLLHNPDLRKKNLRVFITTHSNHLLDTALLNEDTSIFTFTLTRAEENAPTLVEQVEGGDINILDLLGVNNSSVFLSQCSIWVEGISDRLILTAYLKVYSDQQSLMKRFSEDLHFSFLEYAGSNISHYLFDEDNDKLEEIRKIRASSIGNRLWVLADEDPDTPYKKARHKKLKAMNDDHFVYQTTAVREIENTLPWNVIGDFLVDELKIDRNAIKKMGIIEADYRNEKLGAFIQKKFKVELKERRLVDKYGGLKSQYKTRLAEYVYKRSLDSRFTYADFAANKEAVRLAKSLYDFLMANCKA